MEGWVLLLHKSISHQNFSWLQTKSIMLNLTKIGILNSITDSIFFSDKRYAKHASILFFLLCFVFLVEYAMKMKCNIKWTVKILGHYVKIFKKLIQDYGDYIQYLEEVSL